MPKQHYIEQSPNGKWLIKEEGTHEVVAECGREDFARYAADLFNREVSEYEQITELIKKYGYTPEEAVNFVQNKPDNG